MTTKLLTAAFSIAASIGLCGAQGASLPDARVAPPTAAIRIADANYCFARVRLLSPERQPPSYLVLRLKVQVAYLNSGSRPLIIPLEHERTIYTSLKPGVMNVFKELPGIDGLSPSLKIMKELPPKVSPDSPIDPKNNVFAVVPAHGNVIPSAFEEITLPVNHRMLFRHDPDLRGHRLYLRLQLTQQEMTPALETDLSDRWTNFGAPWTGSMLTNVVMFDVPRQITPSGPCIDGPFENPGNHSNDIGK